MVDCNLRDLLDLAAGEPPILLTVTAVRHRAMRRRMAQMGAAALAFVLTAGLATAVASGVLRGSPAAGNSGKTSGPPPYYVQMFHHAEAEAVVVRATATGHITTTIAAPRRGMTCGDGNVGLAPAENQTFFMSCDIWHEKPGPGKITFLESFIYRFHLTSTGRVSGMSLVKGSMLKGTWVYNIAASPDGSQIAAEAIRPGPSGQIYTDSVPEGIFVINTKTGARVLWHTGPDRPGTVQYADGLQLSFTHDGSELVVLEQRCKRGRYVANCNTQETQLRGFGPADRGGSLEAGQLLLPNRLLSHHELLGAAISPDGSAVTVLMRDCPRGGRACPALSVVRISVTSGEVLQTLYQSRTVFAQTLISDLSGSHFILLSDNFPQLNGWIDHGRIVPLAPSGGTVTSAIYETW